MDDALYSIGELARRTGLTVKTIRFYADCGIVPPTDRSPGGYRRFGTDAVARLDLVRTLRDLGLDLATIRKVVDREVPLPEIAAAHAEALAVQIRVLRLRRAVLTAVAAHGATPEEMDLMHQLATLSEDERRRLIDEFLDSAFGGLDTGAGFAGTVRSMTPELPDDPDTDQVEAWIELAGLTRDPDFRAGLRRATERWADDRARAGTAPLRPDPATTVVDLAVPALAAGLNPCSPEADQVVAAAAAGYAHAVGRPDDADLRLRLLTRLQDASHPRRQRYLHLLAVINGWPAPQRPAPAHDWLVRALRARSGRADAGGPRTGPGAS
ncbi:MerR family transcriptional regulator [Kitasatospora sp. NPDC058965]|uniref:MerR family transcriptional regulator n=1 Tax=Kitasatospora sp. NPDC058965 TaxID=3346682 RepID=UPI00368F96EB